MIVHQFRAPPFTWRLARSRSKFLSAQVLEDLMVPNATLPELWIVLKLPVALLTNEPAILRLVTFPSVRVVGLRNPCNFVSTGIDNSHTPTTWTKTAIEFVNDVNPLPPRIGREITTTGRDIVNALAQKGYLTAHRLKLLIEKVPNRFKRRQ
jgi:hypothetical protein